MPIFCACCAVLCYSFMIKCCSHKYKVTKMQIHKIIILINNIHPTWICGTFSTCLILLTSVSLAGAPPRQATI